MEYSKFELGLNEPNPLTQMRAEAKHLNDTELQDRMKELRAQIFECKRGGSPDDAQERGELLEVLENELKSRHSS